MSGRPIDEVETVRLVALLIVVPLHIGVTVWLALFTYDMVLTHRLGAGGVLLPRWQWQAYGVLRFTIALVGAALACGVLRTLSNAVLARVLFPRLATPLAVASFVVIAAAAAHAALRYAHVLP